MRSSAPVATSQTSQAEPERGAAGTPAATSTPQRRRRCRWPPAPNERACRCGPSTIRRQLRGRVELADHVARSPVAGHGEALHVDAQPRPAEAAGDDVSAVGARSGRRGPPRAAGGSAQRDRRGTAPSCGRWGARPEAPRSASRSGQQRPRAPPARSPAPGRRSARRRRRRRGRRPARGPPAAARRRRSPPGEHEVRAEARAHHALERSRRRRPRARPRATAARWKSSAWSRWPNACGCLARQLVQQAQHAYARGARTRARP